MNRQLCLWLIKLTVCSVLKGVSLLKTCWNAPASSREWKAWNNWVGALGRLCCACWHIVLCGLFVLSASDVSEIENLDELEVYGDSDKAAGTTLTSYIFEVRAHAELYSSIASRHALAIPCSLLDYLQRMCLWWSFSTLYLLYTHARWEDVPLVELLMIDWLMITYISQFSALLSRLTALACGLHEWQAFYSTFFEYPLKWCTYSAGMAGATWNCSHLSASSVYTIQPCTMSLHAKPHM